MQVDQERLDSIVPADADRHHHGVSFVKKDNVALTDLEDCGFLLDTKVLVNSPGKVRVLEGRTTRPRNLRFNPETLLVQTDGAFEAPACVTASFSSSSGDSTPHRRQRPLNPEELRHCEWGVGVGDETEEISGVENYGFF